MKTQIVVKLEYEAIHLWPNAESIPEVSFLIHPHRHIFHFKIWKEVIGLDREIEIIQFKHQIEAYLSSYDHNFDTLSCEQIGLAVLNRFEADRVEVLEDGENGALITKTL